MREQALYAISFITILTYNPHPLYYTLLISYEVTTAVFDKLSNGFTLPRPLYTIPSPNSLVLC